MTAACQRRLTTPQRLADALTRRKKIRWRPMTEAMLADVADGAQSPLELRHLRRVERAHRGTRPRPARPRLDRTPPIVRPVLPRRPMIINEMGCQGDPFR
ncbi:hypothetical protein [Jiangella alba]|uniref:Uncharacterized protein n=1 Tax=Jiangella alba TaxID=561176 RepID=A0A1H5I0P7_9ACTN|nr:hypothetical protein [Jiangella alba]SEE33058.1 hypothetical protein SAMN04488561_1005 [Jiangella alba]